MGASLRILLEMSGARVSYRLGGSGSIYPRGMAGKGSKLVQYCPNRSRGPGLLRRGGFETHLHRLRRTLAARRQEMIRAVSAELPSGCRVSQPDGGYMLWVELPAGFDVMDLHRRALAAGVSIAPGPIFSAQRRYRNCFRLNFGYASTAQTRQGIRTLARLLHSASVKRVVGKPDL
jgi:DNA-binding transcriptional MocR family regulator